MTTWLTAYYTLSVLSLLAVAAAVLYFGLERNMRQEDEGFLTYKIRVLTALLARQPLDRAAVGQEVREEAEISSRSQSPYCLRVLDLKDHVVDETPGMGAATPLSVFPPALAGAPSSGRWISGTGRRFLLAAARVPGWRIQAALDVSSREALLAGYRHDIGIVLAGGLLVAACTGAAITRRGLRPLGQITRATERIGAQQLTERIRQGDWPEELTALACAFDRMLDRLQEAFERLSQFSADLAHELRTPINNLMGEAQVALSRPREAAEYARTLTSALEEYSRLARMIDSMLFLAQADRAEALLSRVTLSAHAELAAIADFYQALADEQGVELVCEGQATVVADPLLLRRALSNLLSNALKATPGGGRVTLRAAVEADGTTVLSVSDQGSGIAAEHLPRLGDRFYRVDPARSQQAGGAGLGLSIVKSIATLHGGRLRIDSAPGRGTVASLILSSARAGVPVSLGSARPSELARART